MASDEELSREFESFLPAFEALLPLTEEQRARAMRWLVAKFELELDGER